MRFEDLENAEKKEVNHVEQPDATEQFHSFQIASSMTSAKELANWFIFYCKNFGYSFPANMMTDRIINGNIRMNLTVLIVFCILVFRKAAQTPTLVVYSCRRI